MFTPQQIKEIRLSPVADHAMEYRLDGPKIFWKVNGGKSLSQKKFGRLIGWGDITVARWESGATTPSRANNLILDAWKSSSDFRYLVALRFQDYLEGGEPMSDNIVQLSDHKSSEKLVPCPACSGNGYVGAGDSVYDDCGMCDSQGEVEESYAKEWPFK